MLQDATVVQLCSRTYVGIKKNLPRAQKISGDESGMSRPRARLAPRLAGNGVVDRSMALQALTGSLFVGQCLTDLMQLVPALTVDSRSSGGAEHNTGKTRKRKKQSGGKRKDKRQPRSRKSKRAKAGAQSLAPGSDVPSRKISRLVFREIENPPVAELERHIEVAWGDETYAVGVKSERNMALFRYVASRQRKQQHDYWSDRTQTVEGVPPHDVIESVFHRGKCQGRELTPGSLLRYWWKHFKEQSLVYRWSKGRWVPEFGTGKRRLRLSPNAVKLLDSLFRTTSTYLKTARLSLGDPKRTWISWDEKESYQDNAITILEAKRRDRLGENWKQKPFCWVEREYVVRQGGREVDRPSSTGELLNFIRRLGCSSFIPRVAWARPCSCSSLRCVCSRNGTIAMPPRQSARYRCISRPTVWARVGERA